MDRLREDQCYATAYVPPSSYYHMYGALRGWEATFSNSGPRALSVRMFVDEVGE